MDMIVVVCGDQVSPPIIYSPDERRKGITADMLYKAIQDVLAQAAGALDRYPLYLVYDRATIHNDAKVLEAFNDWGCQELKEVIKLPTQSAKRLSPLDNSLFHDWKERCRKRGILTKENIQQIMADEWNAIAPERIKAHYHHCGLFRSTHPYFDCPDAEAHEHES